MSIAWSVGGRRICSGFLCQKWHPLNTFGTYVANRALTPPSIGFEKLQRFALISTSASRSVRKKKNKLKFRYSRVPDRVLRQKEGDFPVQLRPDKPLEIQDLQDTALDERAFGDVDRVRVPKPHKVREVLRERAPPPYVGTLDDQVRVQSLQNRHIQMTQVTEFDPERDLPEEDAADLAAHRARELAKRNYKFMPNPFGDAPGALGQSPDAEAKYYARYFDGRRPAEDHAPPVGTLGAREELKDNSREPPRRKKVYPKRFWYTPEHVTPDVHTVHMMKSRELKYAMVNEAHLVRKWRTGHSDGRAAGMPPGSIELWMAFGYRAAELARGLTLTKPGPARIEDGYSSDNSNNPSATPNQGLQHQRCSLSSTLRFLQAIASVQAGPYSAVTILVQRVLEHLHELKPQQGFFLLQAMSRLRFRHNKAVSVLERMSLVWNTIPRKKLIKTANAVAKLDLGGNLWAKPLKLALTTALPHLSGRDLANLKSIAVLELFDDPTAMQSYLKQCEETRSEHWYSRHLQMVELHVHLLHPELWDSLDEDVRLFLQEMRTASERSRDASTSSASPQSETRDDSGYGSNSDGELPSDSDSDDDNRGSQGGPWKPTFDKRHFSSAVHQDVSRILKNVFGIDHHNQLAAGPMTVDICHLPTMTIIEVAAPWQFYLRSVHLTALARRRQELLRAMGFGLVHVPYHRWDVLEDDEDKAAFLRSLLPSEMLSSKSRSEDMAKHMHGTHSAPQ